MAEALEERPIMMREHNDQGGDRGDVQQSAIQGEFGEVRGLASGQSPQRTELNTTPRRPRYAYVTVDAWW
jgi:hypothetical protein